MLNSEEASCSLQFAIEELKRIDPNWTIHLGDPGEKPGWLRGVDFKRSGDGPFLDLLHRIAQRLQTVDKRTVAASFALRFGWCASAAIGPYLVGNCVPDVTLPNIALKFRLDTLFEQTALLSLQCVDMGQASKQAEVLDRHQKERHFPLKVLRQQLKLQAEPVVEALYEWSYFSRKGSWGMITSAWATQFINICEHLGGQAKAAPILREFFRGHDEIALMQPQLHSVQLERTTHLYQRRASCCRYYLLPEGDLCASCPLVSDKERLRRNKEWVAYLSNRSHR
jgi:ferric iron reductase protein FhuF